jgi:hypothetical protein
VVRADLVEHPDLAGPLIRILVDVEILLGHGIDVSLGATFSDVHHLAADSDKPARIVRVLDADSDPGSRRMFLSLTRPLALLMMTYLPSKSTHTGLACGDPSLIMVVRWAKDLFLKRSAKSCAFVLAMGDS